MSYGAFGSAESYKQYQKAAKRAAVRKEKKHFKGYPIPKVRSKGEVRGKKYSMPNRVRNLKGMVKA